MSKTGKVYLIDTRKLWLPPLEVEGTIEAPGIICWFKPS